MFEVPIKFLRFFSLPRVESFLLPGHKTSSCCLCFFRVMMAWRGGLSSSSFHSAPQSPIQQLDEEEGDDNDAEVLAVSDQRTLYLVNIYIGNTVRFLNSFSSICEDKLSQLHRRILRLDATLTLLEAKISGTSHRQDLEDNSCLEGDGFLSSSRKEKRLDPPYGSIDS
ncbi:uncharacterized protein M6B38_115715 [Iris pallida]|uniref:Uncharacterized protein n=1 Tax=Iris pallida TaxID=29817 RepID=A0AAX6I4S1_IRIPA|nr:uncharacterized protein M6B38_115715 [Iris pallida]